MLSRHPSYLEDALIDLNANKRFPENVVPCNGKSKARLGACRQVDMKVVVINGFPGSISNVHVITSNPWPDWNYLQDAAGLPSSQREQTINRSPTIDI